jgi:hypothetical protein
MSVEQMEAGVPVGVVKVDPERAASGVDDR